MTIQEITDAVERIYKAAGLDGSWGDRDLLEREILTLRDDLWRDSLASSDNTRNQAAA